MKTETHNEENDDNVNYEAIADIMQSIERMIPQVLANQKAINTNGVLRQWFSFVIIITILLSAVMLAYCEVVDGSAVIGILGAIAGYIFGNK